MNKNLVEGMLRAGAWDPEGMDTVKPPLIQGAPAGPYVQLRGARTIYVLSPDPYDYTLDDVALGLAHTHRFGGAAGAYSVAQHSVEGVQELREEGHATYALRGFLFHDAHEIVTGDLGTPIKEALRLLGAGDAWREIVRAQVSAVERRFGVRTHWGQIRRMDARMCVTEARDFLGGPRGPGWPDAAPLRRTLRPWGPERSYRAFLEEASRLGVS